MEKDEEFRYNIFIGQERDRMRRFDRQKLPLYVILALMIIGLLSMMLRNIGNFLIPVLVFGTIFLLYKFPPNQWNRMFHQARSRFSATGTRGGRRTKRAKFRVIPGSKKEDDDIPKYH